jgi:hypothetical protein
MSRLWWHRLRLSGSGRKKLAVAAGLILAQAAPAVAQHQSVVSTPHNLSASGPGEIHAVSETEVCKLCHIPHNAEVPVPLWSRPLSKAQYLTPEVRAGGEHRTPAPQPDGSSRLCLSCHDGTIALGEVLGEPQPIAMAGAERIHPGRKGFIGTDLSGSHPVSFVVTPSDLEGLEDTDIGIRSLSAIVGDGDVRLDAEGKMQCTTCHDPHADRYFVPGRMPRFWVRPTVDEVCLTCHVLR